MKVYLVYAKEIKGNGEQFVTRVFALEENATQFVKEWNNNNYLIWYQETTLADSL